MAIATAVARGDIVGIAAMGKSTRDDGHKELQMSTLASLFPSLSGQIGRANITSGQAVLRGLLGRCPNCGRGRMFSRFLKVADRCPACGEELFHQRADDFPAYLVIVLVGHIVVPSMLVVETEYAPPLWLEATFWPAVTLAMALALIQPIKGAIVAIQWYGQMLGFGQPNAAEESASGS
jgi:uncharacterized protein (DUF983 family)